MKGIACSSLHTKCFLKRASLSFIGEMLTPTVQLFFSPSGFLLDWEPVHPERKETAYSRPRLHPIKVKDPGYLSPPTERR
jgi:hypothetical protein